MILEDRLAHIPFAKRRELVSAVEFLFQEFEEGQKGKLAEKNKRGRILKVILFGSFARGDWTDDYVNGYVSDFDLLVIVNYDRFGQDYEAWEWAEERYIQHAMINTRPRHTPTLVVHTYGDLNDQLSRGRPFFTDIVRDGIVLYEVPGYPLAAVGPFTEEDRAAEAAGYFESWFKSTVALKAATDLLVERADLREAAFLLHQTTERLYHCVLLTLTLYSPKLHSLRKLRPMAEGQDIRLAQAWPRDTRLARNRFSLLHDAYVKARYSPHYAITAEELGWLVERVEILAELVEQICRERLGDRPEPKS